MVSPGGGPLAPGTLRPPRAGPEPTPVHNVIIEFSLVMTTSAGRGRSPGPPGRGEPIGRAPADRGHGAGPPRPPVGVALSAREVADSSRSEVGTAWSGSVLGSREIGRRNGFARRARMSSQQRKRQRDRIKSPPSGMIMSRA